MKTPLASMLYVLILDSEMRFSGAVFFGGSVCDRVTVWRSGVCCKLATLSFALKLLSVSFLGVCVLLKGRFGKGSGARLGGVQTGSGEKQLVRAGGNFSAGTLIDGSKGNVFDKGRCDKISSLAMGVALDGSVLLLPKSGFATCGGGTHPSTEEAEVREPVREGGSLGPEVAAVLGRDEFTLMIDDRFDEMVEVSDGKMIGDNPGDGSSTVIT
jgi:hypothetical protein